MTWSCNVYLHQRVLPKTWLFIKNLLQKKEIDFITE